MSEGEEETGLTVTISLEGRDLVRVIINSDRPRTVAELVAVLREVADGFESGAVERVQ